MVLNFGNILVCLILQLITKDSCDLMRDSVNITTVHSLVLGEFESNILVKTSIYVGKNNFIVALPMQIFQKIKRKKVKDLSVLLR